MENKVLAVVGGTEVTSEDLQRIVQRYPEDRRGYFESEAGKSQLLEQVISYELMSKFGEELGLDNVIIENKRSEDYVKEARESFDVVTARAVANLSMLSELCIPLVKKDGIFLAMKGMDGYNEESKAMNALNKLGVKRIAVKEANLSDGSLRINLIYQKVKNTPVAYPRNFAKIKKNPLWGDIYEGK